MTSITLKVNGAEIQASVAGTLTSGMVGIPVTIEYDEVWEGLTKNLVCRCSRGTDRETYRTILNVGNTTVVAHEVMQAGMLLYLGVEGYSTDGTLVIPTTWAMCGVIQNGANTGEDLSADPTLPVWNQLQVQIEQIKQDAITQEQVDDIQADVQAARSAAEAAVDSVRNAGGLSSGAKSALMAVVERIAVFTADNPQELIDDLRNALYDAPVASIRAIYTQTRAVYATDSLDVLRDDLVVTATYTDGSSAVRTDYTLSGALSAGTSVVTATLDGKTATFEVTVAAARIPATGITLSSDSINITAGDPVQLAATVEPADSTDTVVWTSSEEAVATVAQDGTVTPVASGSSIITATAGDVSAECAVTVEMPLMGYNYGNPYLNRENADPTTLGLSDEELLGQWCNSRYNNWGNTLGVNSYVFLHPFGPGTHYIRYVNRVQNPMASFYAFANSDIVSNPTATLGKIGDAYTDASVTIFSAFDNCAINDRFGRANIGEWATVDGVGTIVEEGFVVLYKLTVPDGVYAFFTSNEADQAVRMPGISEKYPINDWYTVFRDDPSGNILQIAREVQA